MASVVTTGGKELAADATVADAAGLFTRDAVQAVPVLAPDGRYAGAIDREALAGASPGETVGSLARDVLPTARADASVEDALAALDADGGSRLVVLSPDGTYVGLVCLRRDRRRLCIDADRLEAARQDAGPEGSAASSAMPST